MHGECLPSICIVGYGNITGLEVNLPQAKVLQFTKHAGQGRLCCLDVGSSSWLHSDLLMDGYRPTCTVLEQDFGHTVADANYFPELLGQQLFICPTAPVSQSGPARSIAQP